MDPDEFQNEIEKNDVLWKDCPNDFVLLEMTEGATIANPYDMFILNVRTNAGLMALDEVNDGMVKRMLAAGVSVLKYPDSIDFLTKGRFVG